MADTILEYLEKFGNKTFKRLPFGEVDALILSQFSYLKFDGIVPSPGDLSSENDSEPGSFISLSEIKLSPDFDKLFADTRYEKPNRALFENMLSGERFGELKLNYYVNIVDPAQNIQFSAVTFKLSEGISFVAFRGTDENIVGWKEDFNLAIMDAVPGERESVKYLEYAAGKLEGDFYTGGHSKGGLLATFASSFVPFSIKKRIIDVYCFDSPAMRDSSLSKGGFEDIKDRILKYVPQSSLIGMLFEKGDSYRVVKSTGHGAGQHDPYSWTVADIDFKREPGLKKSAVIINNSVAGWLDKLDISERAHFIDTLFSIADACDIDELVSASMSPVKSIRKLMESFSDMSETDKGFLKDVIGSLIKETGDRAGYEMHHEWSELMEVLDRYINKNEGN